MLVVVQYNGILLLMVLSDLCNTLCFLCYQIYYTVVHFKGVVRIKS